MKLILLFSTFLLIPLSFARDGHVFVPWKGVTDQEVKEKMTRLRETGTSHVSFIVLICQKGLDSNVPGECNNYKSELAQKVSWASLAQAQGMTFDIAPFPYALMEDGSWKWRGEMKPRDVKLWFRNYSTVIREIAGAARALGATHQIVGNEMRALHKYSRQWKFLAEEVRTVTDLPLAMNVNWWEVPQGFWSAFDLIGISAYYPLSLSSHPSVEELVRSWQAMKATILAWSRFYKKPFQFTEVGYPSATGAARLPSNYDYRGRTVDLEGQRRLFEAFRRVWQDEPRLVRAMVWATDVPAPGEDRSKDLTFDVFNKPAQQEVEAFFRRRKEL